MMRDDLVVLDINDAAWLLSALELLEKLASRSRVALPSSVAATKGFLSQHLSRVASRADATTRRPAVAAVDTEIDANEAAERLGITADACRKACRTGRFAGVARKHHGRWWIPTEDVDAVQLDRSA